MQHHRFPGRREANQRPQRNRDDRIKKNRANYNRFPQPEQPGQRTYADAAHSNQPSRRSKRRENKNHHHPNPQKRLPRKPPMKRKYQPEEFAVPSQSDEGKSIDETVRRADFHSHTFPLPKTFEIELFHLDHRYSMSQIQNDILAGLSGITTLSVPPSDRDGHQNRGHAFVTFDSEENCGVAFLRLQQKTQNRGFGVRLRCKQDANHASVRRPKFEERAVPTSPEKPTSQAEGEQRNDVRREGETQAPQTDAQLPKKTFEKKFTRWTPEEEEKLLELSKIKPFPELEVIFGRPATALTQRLRLMKKRKETQKNEKKADAQAS